MHTACFCVDASCVWHAYGSLFGATSQSLEQMAPALPPMITHLAASLVAATTSCALMNPMDVYCTRLFHSSLPTTRESTHAAVRHPSLGGAIAAGYSGLGVNMLRTVPHTMFTFLFLELMRARAAELPSLASLARWLHQTHGTSTSGRAHALARSVTAGHVERRAKVG